MKVYVIKNKEGKYVTRNGDTCEGLLNANFIEEEYKSYHNLYKDEYWQEVTICEGDIEKELAVYKKALVTLNFNFGVISEILVSQSKKESTNEQTRQEIIKCLDNIDFTLDEMKEKLGYDVFIKLRKELEEKNE